MEDQQKERRDRIDQMLRDGATVHEVVAAEGCSPGTVTSRRKALGITSRRSDVDPGLLAEARRMYEMEGLTFHAIMKRTGIAHATLSKAAKDQGWTRQVSRVKQGQYVPPDNLLEIWEGLDKKNAAALGRALGIEWGVAYKIVTAHDLPGRRTNESALVDYAKQIRIWYVEEGLTDALIADRLQREHNVTITENGVYWYRVHTLKIESDRRGRKVGRFSQGYRLSQVGDEQLVKDLDATEQEFLIGRHAAGRRTRSVQRLAKQYGCSGSTMHLELKKRGILVNRFSFAQDAARIQDMFQSGDSVPKIADRLGCTQDFVRSVLHRLGIDLSNYQGRMSAEEHRQWRIAIRQGRARSEKEGGRFVHQRSGVRMDSTYEIRFADYCDQYGLEWERFKRTEESLLAVSLGGDLETLYGPDFWVTHNGERVLVEVKGIYGADDAIKVASWREERGELALMTQHELSDFFVAKTAQEAFDIIKASVLCFPPVKLINRNGSD